MCCLFAGGSFVEIKMEADSYDLTEYSYDDKPSAGKLGFSDAKNKTESCSVFHYYALINYNVVCDTAIRICRTHACKKVVPYSITSVGLGADSGFLAVSPQVTLVINPVVGCH